MCCKTYNTNIEQEKGELGNILWVIKKVQQKNLTMMAVFMDGYHSNNFGIKLGVKLKVIEQVKVFNRLLVFIWNHHIICIKESYTHFSVYL